MRAARPSGSLAGFPGDPPIPDSAWFWLFDEGAGDYAYANRGGDATRFLRAASYGAWVSGVYGGGIYAEVPSGSGTGWTLADPDTNLPLGEPDRLTIAYWLRRNGQSCIPLNSTDGFYHFNSATWIGVPYNSAGVYGRTNFYLALSLSEDWQHWAFVMWVENGYTQAEVYQDGDLVLSKADLAAADTLGRWGTGSLALLGDNSLQSGGPSLDELLIAPGWKATSADIQRLYRQSLGALNGHVGRAEVLAGLVTGVSGGGGGF